MWDTSKKGGMPAKFIYSQNAERLTGLLRDFAASRGLSIRDLASKLEMSKSSVGRLLEGQRKLEFLEWLEFCKKLDIDPVNFLDLLKDD